MPDHADAAATVAVADVLPEFAEIFPFERFNRMQTDALPALTEREDNVVVSAPTASGKTALAEIAISETVAEGGTALFLAPLRALTNEKEREWERFETAGYDVEVVTGERELDPARARRADVLVMTPEKADSATRNHDASRYEFVTDVDCVVIDEVHLLDSDRRGAVLEVTVARLRRLCSPRVIALSATMRNVDDVADWLDAPPETTLSYGDDYRPVPLDADVATYTHGDNAFADKYRRLYRALDLVEPHLREDGQALVFVASRQDTVRAAEKTRDELAERDVPVGARGDYDHHTDAQSLSDDTLRQSVIDGVGFHHAGLAREDKNKVEEWFREGRIDVLFSTSTLAWGVNLPARCVVIRDTSRHDPLEGDVEMSHLDVLQMLGRAGRPQYDDKGYAWVVCDHQDADRYSKLLREGKDIDSHLADELDGHLNAEVACGLVEDVAGAREWLQQTFYHHRERAKAEAAGAGGDGTAPAPGGDVLEATLLDLVDRGFLDREDGALEPTTLGRLASQYYLRLDTARRFADVAERVEAGRADADDAGDGSETTDADGTTDADDPIDQRTVLRAVAGAAEFDDVSARGDESDAIDAVLGDRAESLDPGQRKVLAILTTATTGSTPAQLRSDAWVIRQNAQRLLSALRAILDALAGPLVANAARRVAARVEHGVSADAVGLTAIDGVGATRASSLAATGLRTPADVAAATVEELVAAGLDESVAERVRANAADCPAVVVEWGDLPESIAPGERVMHEVTVRSTAGGAQAGVTLTVNGRSMTETAAYLGETSLPLAIFGADAETLRYELTVAFPDEPIPPVRTSRTIRVE